jgi:uncharacterized alkaline shock family protein YloU
MTEYVISAGVLECIVGGSLPTGGRTRVHSPLPFARTRAIEVTVDGQTCSVVVHLDARLGESMPALASEARVTIADGLSRMAGLTASSVDVVFASVFPSA